MQKNIGKISQLDEFANFRKKNKELLHRIK